MRMSEFKFHRILLSFLLPILLLASLADGSVVGLMATDEEELGNIVSFFESPVNKYTHGMRTFYKGQLWGLETVIVLSNVGKAAAAAATVDLINEKVDCIVFLGTAGALDRRLNIGDVVIAKSLIEFDVDFRPFTALYSFPDRKRGYHMDSILGEKAREAISDFLEKEVPLQAHYKFRQEMQIKAPKVITAAVGTSDHFLISKDDIHNLTTYASDVVCIDMESAAAAQVANSYGIPLTIIRTVSDCIEDASDRVARDYTAFLQKVQAFYTKNILQRLFAKIQVVERKPIDLQIYEKPLTAGILCTTKKELAFLSRLLEGQAKITTRGRDFYQGRIGKHQVVIAASGFGKSAASAMAEDLILIEKVKCLLVVGNAFSVDANVAIGDVVISKSLIEHDVDVRPFRPLFQLPTIGVTDLPAHAKMVQIAYGVSTKQGVHIGQVASGDKMLNQNDCLVLKQNLPDVLCIDFEAAPAAQIAYQSDIPFISIKRISNPDLLDAELDDNLLQILQSLFNRLEERDLDE